MDKCLYYIIYAWMYCHALLPLRVLYLFSDVLYYIVYYVARYRRKVARMNLQNAFPDKSSREILRIEKDFYQNLCDYWFETMKLLHISDKEMQRRMQFLDMEEVNKVFAEGHSVLMYLGHYGNWEWVTSITLSANPDVVCGQIYRPLKNKVFDQLFLNLRKRFGSVGIAKEKTLREIVKMRRAGQKTVIGFMSDQTPSPHNIYYWTTFLNQETPVFTGVERIAKQTGFYVFYLDITRVKRGYYQAKSVFLSEDPQKAEDFEITEKYIRLMEQTILRNPAYWLWTHNRWKYKR